MSDAMLIVDWLQQREHPTDDQVETLLDRCQADPELGRQVKELLLIDEALSWLFDPAREDFGNRVRKGLAMRQSRRLFASRVSEAVNLREQQQRQRRRRILIAILLLALGGIAVWIWLTVVGRHEPPPQMLTMGAESAALPAVLATIIDGGQKPDAGIRIAPTASSSLRP